MGQLIRIKEENGQKLVSARDLYEGLMVKQDFTDWIKKQLESVDAIENEDFTRILFKREANNANVTDYAITTDIAKEICMVVGISPRTNDETRKLSKRYRKYFIECEKQLNQKLLPTTYKEALLQLVAQVEENEKLQLENAQQKQQLLECEPKVSYYDIVLQTKDLLTPTQIAKDYGMSATEFNKKLHDLGVQFKQSDTWLLYQKYADKGYTKSTTNTYTGNDGKNHSKLHTKWTQSGRLFIYDLFKLNGVVPMCEKETE